MIERYHYDVRYVVAARSYDDIYLLSVLAFSLIPSCFLAVLKKLRFLVDEEHKLERTSALDCKGDTRYHVRASL